jgi:RNA polymerase sigma factor (sigma-70 family)
VHRFIAGSDLAAEAAFATLVERYAPIVHRVCSSVLGNSHDAQDAAQAVFLVLARKARSIQKPGSLGPWLHGVAVRVARRARADASRRRVIERKKAEMMHELASAERAPESIDYSELHEEINRLPEKYRVPVIYPDRHGIGRHCLAAGNGLFLFVQHGFWLRNDGIPVWRQ